MSWNPGSLAFRRGIVITLCCAAAVYLGLKIPEEPMFAVLLLGAAAYFVTLGSNYHWLAWLVIATSPSALIVPGLPGRPFVWEACALAAWFSLIVLFALQRDRPVGLADRDLRRALLCLGLYLGTLLLVMAVRGVGFRVFGGGQMGGRFYVQQLVLAVLPVLFSVVPWRESTLLSAYFAGAALSLTYVLSDLVLVYGGNQLGRFVLQFLEVPTDALNFYVGYEITGLRRFQSFAFVSDALFTTLLVLVPLRSFFGRWAFALWPVAGGIAALGLSSGHRTIFILAILTVVLLGKFQRFYHPVRVLVLVAGLIVAGAVLYPFATRLPLGMQRAISFLPGIEVDSIAANDAAATVRDRVEALKLGLQDVRGYLLVGRGFGLARLDKMSVVDDPVRTAYESGYFDNGAIGLLIKTGVPGFLAALGYVCFVSRAALRCTRLVAARPPGAQDAFDRYCQVVAAKWFAVAGFFLVIRGDASTFMQVLALISGLVFLCARLQEQRAARDVTAIVRAGATSATT